MLGLHSPFPNKQCFSLRNCNAAMKRATLLLTPRGSQRTQHLDLLCVYKCCQTVSLLCSHKFNSIHQKPPFLQLNFPGMLEIDHDTLENREKMRGGRGEKRKIRQMFCLEAEQQIQADGIHIEGQKEKKCITWQNMHRSRKESVTPVWLTGSHKTKGYRENDIWERNTTDTGVCVKMWENNKE